MRNVRKGKRIMDAYGSRYKCEHSKYECPYKDCNYHIKSTGKYSHTLEEDKPISAIGLPFCEEDAKDCMNCMDI